MLTYTNKSCDTSLRYHKNTSKIHNMVQIVPIFTTTNIDELPKSFIKLDCLMMADLIK